MIKQLALVALCSLTLIGCKEKTLDDLRAEVAAREAATAALDAKRAAASREKIEFISTYGYTQQVIKICLEGVQYYYGDIGHAGILAPVIDASTLSLRTCEK